MHIVKPLRSNVCKSLTLYFVTKPYASNGFGLEGFPRNKTDIEFLFAAGLYPDAIINLRVDAETSAQRVLNQRKWEITSDDDEAVIREELLAACVIIIYRYYNKQALTRILSTLHVVLKTI